MDTDFYKEYKYYCSTMVDELYEIYNGYGNVLIRAYFKTSDKKKLYYDFQNLGSSKLRGSFDILEVLELIHYLEEV